MKRAFFVVSRAVAFVALGGLAAIVGVKFLPSQPAQPVLSVLPVAFSFSDAASSAASVPGPKGAAPLTPVGSGFTFHGRLTDGGNPANGLYDLVFSLYDAPSAGNLVGTPSIITDTNQTVAGGLFSVTLDFGSSAFDGNARYMEIAVRQSGVGSYTTLSPRQPITPAPYALFALKTQPYRNVVVVARSGGQYASISAALNSISDASSTNHYLVYVAPGVYTETVTMKQYVDIEGSGEQSTKITFTGSASNNTGTVIGASNAELRFLTVENTGGSTFAIAIYDSGASPSLLHVTASDSTPGGSFNYTVYNNSSSPSMSNVTISASGASGNIGVINTGTSSPAMSNVAVSASGGSGNYGVYNDASSPTMNNVTISASGVSGSTNYGVYNNDASSPIMSNVTASGSGGSSNYGVLNTSGGTVTISNSKITGSTNTIYNDTGTTAKVGASQLVGGAVSNAGTLTCTASYNGNNKRLGTDCTSLTKVALVGLTNGDYTSITAALTDIITWCGTPSPTNRCLVHVNPGTYTERVSMVQYVDIEGSGEQSTKITFTGSASLNTGTVIGASNAELRFLTVENTGGNSYAIAISNSGASPSLLHVTANASGGSLSSVGIDTTNSSPTMNNITISASGSATNIGVDSGTSLPTINNVTISASGGSNNYGVTAEAGGQVKISNSKITGSTNSILGRVGAPISVGASQLSGGPVFNPFNSVTCAGVYDGNFTFYPSTCP